MKPTKTQFSTYLAIACLAVLATKSAQAEVINVGTAFRGGGFSNGFPEFLSQTNASTQAWNLGGAAGDTIFNGFTVVDVPSADSTVGDLTTAGGSAVPLFFPAPTFTGNADGQDAARNAIFESGIQGFAFPAGVQDFTLDIANTTAGQLYQVELLADPNNGNRTADVTVDGTLFADDLYASGSAGGVTLVYRFNVVADVDGINILIGPGSGLQPDGTNLASIAAIFSAISVTNIVPGEFDENADFDADSDVDGQDFLAWQRGFGGPGSLAAGDANSDGAVDGSDLVVWESQYGMPVALFATIAAIPEPTTLGLLLIATSCLFTRRVRLEGKR